MFFPTLLGQKMVNNYVGKNFTIVGSVVYYQYQEINFYLKFFNFIDNSLLVKIN